MSRKITQLVVSSFLNSSNFKLSNTEVYSVNQRGETITEMYLFDNLIARKVGGKLFISNAGWLSATTKERLNGLPNVSITQKKGVWYLNGKQWDGKLTKVV